MGNNYMESCYDFASTNMAMYPIRNKSDAPHATDQYFRWCKANGVDIDSGGVLYRDNEIVLNSAAMDAVAREHNQDNKNSNEYDPTGNAGVESTFRILPHEMRKNAIRSGVPDEFWLLLPRLVASASVGCFCLGWLHTPEEHSKYREIIGAILYVATVCRPDIAVAVGLLSRVLEVPTADTMTAAMRVLRYLVSTKELGLRWTVGADTVLSGMSDSNWAVVKSTSGYVFFLAQAAIAYVSKKQASIAMSSTEAEIMAASLAALEAVFLRGLLSELDCLQESPTVLGVDNQGAIALAKNYVSNSRTKHIERRHLKIRELVEELAVRPEFVPTDGNVADILSKPLGRDKFEKFRRVLLNHEV